MIKLTFTLVLAEVRIISGAGVVSAWGGCTSPQPEAEELTCGTSLNWEVLVKDLQAVSSRSASVAGRIVGTGALTFAKASADTAKIKTGQRRCIGSKSFFEISSSKPRKCWFEFSAQTDELR
jgi:hypothetical protein